MSFKTNLLQKGYLPENLPPPFGSQQIATYFNANTPKDYISVGNGPVRPASYNASKRGMSRRTFSVIHPTTGYDLAQFLEARWAELIAFLKSSKYSLSTPEQTPDGERSIKISSHTELEAQRFSRLSQYRFIAKTDISRFYHSIYTHSVPWAVHGKAKAKADREAKSKSIFCNRVDFILRCGQDGQTIGIPVGPDASRIIAELISTAIDLEFQTRCDVAGVSVIRHVDDVWIGANSHADAERALWRYRESIREFELDINESKTRIYEADFKFADAWPTDISSQLDFAIQSNAQRLPERLRAALEYVFAFGAGGSDDAVLRYAIRYVDQSDLKEKYWDCVEPFLKRAAVHFGHTIDYVMRIVIWRHLARQDLHKSGWSNILGAILDRQGRLGNDSEVCWAIYACMRLDIPISESVASNILKNCGALSILALLNCIEAGLASPKVFGEAFDLVSQESANGPYWPVLLEWRSRKWPRHKNVPMDNDLIKSMSDKSVALFVPETLPKVFRDMIAADFSSVAQAIEPQVGFYDDGENRDDNEEEPDPF